MIEIFWTLLLAALVLILIAMLLLMFLRKSLVEKLNYIFAMNTVIVLIILTVGYIDGRRDMYIDIALSYSLLGFVTSVILSKYVGGHRK